MAEESARARVLARIRRRMPEADRAAAVAARLGTPKANLVPERGKGDLEHRVALFTRLMEAVGGSVERVEDVSHVPQSVAAYLRANNLPARLRRGADALLATLPWHRAGTLEVEEGRARDADTASLSRAFAGVAESATVLLTSGPDNPTTLNFLPEAHIVLLEAERLHGDYETAIAQLRAQGPLPRTVNMISGPSRTGDVEQTIVRPAHGPKNMHVIIVG